MRVLLSSIPRRIVVSDDSSYVTIGELCEHFSCSRMWIERRLRDAVLRFPTPYRFGGKTCARRWLRSEVAEWETARAKLGG